MLIYDIATPTAPTFVRQVRGDFETLDGRRHPARAWARWTEDDWAANTGPLGLGGPANGTWRPFVRVRAVAPEGRRIVSAHDTFNLTNWPHQVIEVIDETVAVEATGETPADAILKRRAVRRRAALRQAAHDAVGLVAVGPVRTALDAILAYTDATGGDDDDNGAS